MYSSEWSKLSQEHQSLIRSYQQEFPVKIGGLAKELAIIVRVSTLSAGISGQIKEEDGTVTIKVNKGETKTRQRFTIAHEISHFLLHRHLLREGISDDVLYRSNASDSIELEANKLAADILIPEQEYQRVNNELLSSYSGDQLHEKVADYFGISTTALKKKLGIW
ncbi:ImmA/IrrE family metallo-endopeptidase [Enterovibrio norvegicus]|uniref:ImmA/IrrE family metallo-endopeptidase n=1 Tax=Enterovibrio norvegicus TaxID=188144 RepID=UPI000C832184|nr:ImmA/IrrE family metallo-endopeptidase [Enterovibrio norvegicus]PMH68376.1 hypothetical protein BCU62_00685 [Enterovibrio norvegicus]